jgi:long-chain acyl-CoA synthetase
MENPWLRFYDPSVPANLQYPDVCLPQILDDTADQFPEKVGVFFFGGKIKYGALRAHADQFAGALRSIGFRKGDRVGIILANMPQAIISAFGVAKAGGVAVFFDPREEEEELQRQINDSGIEIAVVLGLVLPRIDPILRRTKLKQFIIARVRDYLPFPRNYFFDLAARGRGLEVKIAKKTNIHLFREFLLKGRSGAEPLKYSGSPGEAAVMLYTGGASGPPKGVVLSHRNLVANLLQAAAWVGKVKKATETYLSILPFHQAFGLTLAMNLPIHLAAMAIYQPQFEVTQVLVLIKKHRPTSFPATPSMIESLAHYPFDLDKFKVSTVKAIWSTGGPLEPEVMQNLERRIGRRVCEAYGLAEASPFTHAVPLQGKRKAGSIGIPLPDTEAKIVDGEGGEKEKPPGELGELVVRGPQVMKGYWNRPGETERVLRQEWLHTGDLARMDEEGFFYLGGKIAKK